LRGQRAGRGAAAVSMGVPPRPGGTKGLSTTGGPQGFSEARQRSLLSLQLFYSNYNKELQKQARENLLSTRTCSKVFWPPPPSSLHTLPHEFLKFCKKSPAKGTFFSSKWTPLLGELYNTSLYWENAALCLSTSISLYSQREVRINPHML